MTKFPCDTREQQRAPPPPGGQKAWNRPDPPCFTSQDALTYTDAWA
jgi:hypothetical protein